MTWDELLTQWHDGNASLLCHTSGSTGKPKEIYLPKEQVASSARRTLKFFGLDATSHLHSCISPDYIGGKMMLIRAEISGASFSWETPSNRSLENYSGGRIDMMSVVPSQMWHLLDNMADLPEIGIILVGGSAMPATLRRRIAESGLNVWESYGMTETASHVALRPVTYPETPFTPLPGITVSAPRETLDITIPGWMTFHTNDIVSIHDDGRFTILGRSDNAIITGGLKVHPEMVESTLGQYISSPLMITSEPDDKWGEKVILVIEDPELDDNSIMDLCHERLPRHCVPKEIRHGLIPRTDNGKIKRNR